MAFLLFFVVFDLTFSIFWLVTMLDDLRDVTLFELFQRIGPNLTEDDDEFDRWLTEMVL